MTILGIIVGLLVLSILVALHELGHALAARRNGVVVEEYAIGFPPTVWSKKLKSGVKFLINALPIGGYVKLQGEYDSADQKGDYGNAGYWGKTKILLAGVAVNFVVAILLFTVLAATSGIPKVLSNQAANANDQIMSDPVTVVYLEKNSPAEQAGAKVGDEILSLANETVNTPLEFSTMTEKMAGQTVELKIRRHGEEKALLVSLRSKDKADNEGFIGISPAQQTYIKTAWYQAPTLAIATTAQFSWETLKGVGQLIGNFFGGLLQKISSDPSIQKQGEENLAKASESVAGPIAMLGTIFPALLSTDVATFVFFVAIISLTLAIMNLLPIPGLDGGRWLLMTIFKIARKPLSKEIENKVQTVGMLILFSLMILVIISDIGKMI